MPESHGECVRLESLNLCKETQILCEIQGVCMYSRLLYKCFGHLHRHRFNEIKIPK